MSLLGEGRGSRCWIQHVRMEITQTEFRKLIALWFVLVENFPESITVRKIAENYGAK